MLATIFTIVTWPLGKMWHHRLATGVLLSLLMIGGMYAFADAQAEAEQAAVNAKLEALGYEVGRFEYEVGYGFVLPQPPADSLDAALNEVLSAQMVEGPLSLNFSFPEGILRSPIFRIFAKGAHKANAPVFDKLRATRSLPMPETPVMESRGNLSQFVEAVAAEAVYEHLMGNDAETIELLIDLLRISKFLRLDISSESRARRAEFWVCNIATMIGPRLNRSAKASARPASAQQLDRLTRMLLASDWRKHRLVEAMIGESATIGRYYRWFGRPGWEAENDMLFGPHVKRESTRIRFMALLAATEEPKTVLRRDKELFDSFGAPSMRFAFYRRSLTDEFLRRATAVSIAWHRYQREHGKPSKDVQQLVKAGLLPHVPKSPLHTDEPFRLDTYGKTPDGRKRWVVAVSTMHELHRVLPKHYIEAALQGPNPWLKTVVDGAGRRQFVPIDAVRSYAAMLADDQFIDLLSWPDSYSKKELEDEQWEYRRYTGTLTPEDVEE